MQQATKLDTHSNTLVYKREQQRVFTFNPVFANIFLIYGKTLGWF
jgi:hypothetical protein